MAKISSETAEKKLASIRSGAYVFGIIGRLSLMAGVLLAVIFMFSIATGGPKGEYVTSGIPYLIYGWLFLKARDAFVAIEALIVEIGEIV